MKLSIITINKNNLRGLKKTMDSVLMQTSKDYEWIIIDGGSTDGSVDLINENAEHIAYWVSEPDSGIYQAMNKGIIVATGDYLQFLNSGDCLASSDIVSSFIGNHLHGDVVYGNAIIVDNNNMEIYKYQAPEFVTLSYFWNKRLNHQATFFKSHCFAEQKYDEGYSIISDVKMYMYLLYNGFSYEKWDVDVVRFETGGIGSQNMLLAHDEFCNALNQTLPAGIKADYDEFIQIRDVDLYKTIKRIVNSRRWVRNLARLVLLPFQLILK